MHLLLMRTIMQQGEQLKRWITQILMVKRFKFRSQKESQEMDHHLMTHAGIAKSKAIGLMNVEREEEEAKVGVEVLMTIEEKEDAFTVEEEVTRNVTVQTTEEEDHTHLVIVIQVHHLIQEDIVQIEAKEEEDTEDTEEEAVHTAEVAEELHLILAISQSHQKERVQVLQQKKPSRSSI